MCNYNFHTWYKVVSNMHTSSKGYESTFQVGEVQDSCIAQIKG